MRALTPEEKPALTTAHGYLDLAARVRAHLAHVAPQRGGDGSSYQAGAMAQRARQDLFGAFAKHWGGTLIGRGFVSRLADHHMGSVSFKSFITHGEIDTILHPPRS